MSDKSTVKGHLKTLKASLSEATQAEETLVAFIKDKASSFYGKILTTSDSVSGLMKGVKDDEYWSGTQSNQFNTEGAYRQIEVMDVELDDFMEDVLDEARELVGAYQNSLQDLNQAIRSVDDHDERLTDVRVSANQDSGQGLNELYGV